MLKRIGILACAAVAALCLQVAGASAQATRTWVSGVGDDVNPCSRTAPCKTFAGAISKTATGGEINAIDQGAFGAVTITKAISIIVPSGTAGVLATLGSSGIIVNAPSAAKVVLQGLDIEGAGTGGDGIRVISASRVQIRNCNIRNFSDAGVDVQGPAGTRVTIEDSVISGNAVGVRALGTGGASNVVTILNATIERNTDGVEVTGTNVAVLRGSNLVNNTGEDLNLISGGRAKSAGDNLILTGDAPTDAVPLR